VSRRAGAASGSDSGVGCSGRRGKGPAVDGLARD
jgi:hypothetical protein